MRDDGSRSSVLRGLARRLPPRIRRVLREAAAEAPIRFRDALPDLLDRWRRTRSAPPLPPAPLRRRVALTSRRDDFLRIGAEAAADVLETFALARDPTGAYPRWLDFGCGPGRVARHLARRAEIRELWGVDVDRASVAWAAAHLPGHFAVVEADPPAALPESAFDVVYAGSVFTHFDEARQLRWLAELARFLRPGGLLIASTHGPSLAAFRPDLSDAQRVDLARRGFLFAPGGGPFSEDSAFHSAEYLTESWSPHFSIVRHLPYGLNRFQDLVACRKPESPSAPRREGGGEGAA